MTKQVIILTLNCLLLLSPPALGQTRTKELERRLAERKQMASGDKLAAELEAIDVELSRTALEAWNV